MTWTGIRYWGDRLPGELVVKVADAEEEIEKARAEERKRIGEELLALISPERWLDAMYLCINKPVTKDPKPLEHRTRPLSLTAEDWNAMVDAVNELRAKR